MHTNNKSAIKFISLLLENPMVKELEFYDDQGIKVSTHTYDVFRYTCKDIEKKFKSFELATEKIDLFSIIIGIIIHDLSKVSIRQGKEELSHSQMMIKNPEYVIKESEKLLSEIENMMELKIKKNIMKKITHIVVSHHGKWGKVQPSSQEAHLVHKADEYSAKHHRINPVGADKILKLLAEGIQIPEIEKILKCTQGIIKDRLKKAKEELGLKSTKNLLTYYIKNKKVPLGSKIFELRLRETEELVKLVDAKGLDLLIREDKVITFLEDKKIFELA
jgi:23S rRNA maturation-related 3'-5' exoribonuclease YhaM